MCFVANEDIVLGGWMHIAWDLGPTTELHIQLALLLMMIAVFVLFLSRLLHREACCLLGSATPFLSERDRTDTDHLEVRKA